MTESMPMMPTITFGDDGSPGADVAWGWITAQRWPGWTVDVITVTDPSPRLESLFTHEPLHAFEPAVPRLAPPDSEIAEVRHLTTAFDPRVILSEREDTSLLVVGARGRGLLKAMHIGSTAEWLLQCPTAPTVIARSSRPVRTVLACIDGSAHAQAAVAALARMPWVTDTRVTLLSVRENGADLEAAIGAASAVLASAGAPVDAVTLETDPTAITTTVRHTIIDQVDQRAPDLVVLGTAGVTGWERVRVGSVAGTVAHHAPGTVLLARAE